MATKEGDLNDRMRALLERVRKRQGVAQSEQEVRVVRRCISVKSSLGVEMAAAMRNSVFRYVRT